MSERSTPKIGVFTTIFNQAGEVFLMRRAGTSTGYLDGYYDFPSGHLDPGKDGAKGESVQEGAARELLEEAGVNTNPADLELFHVCQNTDNPANPYIYFMFQAARWTGEPTICEPNRCDAMGFFPIDKLPEYVTPYTRQALANLALGQAMSYSNFGPGEIIWRPSSELALEGKNQQENV